MFINIIKSYRYITAVCDKELIGKRFEEGKFIIEKTFSSEEGIIWKTTKDILTIYGIRLLRNRFAHPYQFKPLIIVPKL